LKELAAHRNMSLSALIREIQANQRYGNLCSAIRMFVLDVYRDQIETISHANAERERLSAAAS